jgi:hypothetical protein
VLCHEPLINQAARNRRVPVGLRFAAQRLVELLDAGSPLIDSAAFCLSPDVAVVDSIDLLRGYQTRGAQLRLRALEALGRFVSVASHIDSCLDASAHAGAALTAAADTRDAIAYRRPDESAAIKRGLDRLSELHAEIGEGKMVDLARDAIISSLGGLNELGEADRLGPWTGLDARLRVLAGTLLAEGRGTATAYEFAGALADARASDDASALFAQTVSSTRSTFDVVIVMRGVGRIRLAAGQPFVVLSDVPAFRGVVTNDVDSVLRLYAREAGHGSGDARALLIRIDGRDAEHAARIAVLRGKELANRINAVERQGRFSLHPTALVRSVATGRVTPVSVAPETRPVYETKIGADVFTDPALSASLAYMRRAHNSSSPVGVVMHTWIALEALHAPLAASNRPQDDVVSFAPVIAGGRALAGIEFRAWNTLAWQRGVTAPWEQLRAAVGKADEDGKRRRHCRPQAWRAALMRTSAQYSRQLTDVLDASTPLVRWKVAETRRLLTKREALRGRGNEVVRDVRWASQRMRVTRNLAAHEALVTAPGEEQLARAARLLADAVFEGMQSAARTRVLPISLVQQAINDSEARLKP